LSPQTGASEINYNKQSFNQSAKRMNNQPNPLIPEGSFLEQKNKGRARVKIAVFFVLAVHGIGLMALLMQGCRREETPLPAESDPTTNAVPPTFQATNDPVAPTNDPYLTNTNPLPGVNANNTSSNPPTGAYVPPTATPSEYVVVKGDTFATIAKKVGVTAKALQEANPTVVATKLQINQKLVVPPPTAPAAAAAATGSSSVLPEAGAPVIYKVKSNDTLSRIAAQYHVSVRAIRAANNLTTDSIRVGQTLKIPAKAPAPAPAPTTAPAPQ